MISLRRLGLGLALLAAAAGAAVWLHARAERARAEEHVHARLRAVAALTVEQMAQQWRDRLADVAMLADDPLTAAAAAHVLAGAGDPVARAGVERRLAGLVATDRYAGAALVDAEGRAALVAGAAPDLGTAAARAAVARCLREGRPVRSDPSPAAGTLTVTVAAPVRAPGAGTRPPGAFVLWLDAREEVVRLARRATLADSTAETVLVSRHAGGLVVGRDGAGRGGPGLPVPAPPATPDRPTAAPGQVRVVDGRDDRGVPVLAVAAAVPDSSWFVVTKVDRTPLEHDLRVHFLFAAAFAGLLVLAAATLLLAIARSVGAATLRRDLAVERERVALLQRMEILTRYAHDLVLLIDERAVIVYANERAVETYGYPRDALVGRQVREVLARPSDVRIAARLAEAAARDGLVFVSRHRRADGGTFPVEVSLRRVDLDGAPHYLAVVRDISERTRVEEALRLSEARFRLLATRAPIGLAECDRQGRLTFVSERLAEMARRPADELLGEGGLQYLHPRDRARFAAAWRQMLDDGKERSAEYRARRADGAELWVQATIAPLHSPHGAVIGYLTTVADITACKQAEAALAYNAKLLASLDDAVIAVGADRRVTAWNPAAERLYGWRAAEVLGRPASEVFGALGDLAHLPPPEQYAERPVTVTYRPRRRDGAPLVIELTLLTVPADAAGPRALLGIHRDVTERNRLHARVLRAEHLASLGTLAAGIAHEINNPLAYVLSNVEYALGELRPRVMPDGPVSAEVMAALADAREGAGRVRDIVRDLRRAARGDDEPLHPVDVEEALRLALKTTRNEIHHRARLELQLGPAPPVRASEARLTQIFVNLLVNAAQAIRDGDAAHNLVSLTLGTDAAGRVRVEVADTGVGIPPEDLNRIFDPFFTTKPVGAGMGLGLAIAQSAVAEIGGELTVESSPGRGTVFRVLLPSCAAEDQAPAAAAASAAPGQPRRVLVIDDEPAVGRAIARLLDRALDVVTVTSAAAALARFGAGERFDVIFCDVMMPEMSGAELCRRARVIDEQAARRIVFITGGTFTAEARDELERLPNLVVAKPFSRDQLLEAMQRAQAQAQTPAA